MKKFLSVLLLSSLLASTAYANDIVEEYRGTVTIGKRDDITSVVVEPAGATFSSTGVTMGSGKAIVPNTAVGLTAAGSTQGDALALTAEINQVGTAAASTGVRLWNAPVGTEILVINEGANSLSVYPPSGHTLAGKSVNVHVSAAANAGVACLKKTTVLWYCRTVARAS